MLPNRHSTIDEWIFYDRTRPLFDNWEYQEIKYSLIYEMYRSIHWRELEKFIVPNYKEWMCHSKKRAMNFDEIVEFIKRYPNMTFGKFCVSLDQEHDCPVVCGTSIPKSINVKNYHIIRQLLQPCKNEPMFLQEANRPDLVLVIKHLYPNHDWFCDYEASDNWFITLIRYGIYPNVTKRNSYYLPFSKKDIKKIKKGYRLCVGNMRPRNKWEYDKALFLSLIGYKDSLPLEYYDVSKHYDTFLRYSNYDHVKEYLISKGLMEYKEDIDFNLLDYWDEEYITPIPMPIDKGFYDINIVIYDI